MPDDREKNAAADSAAVATPALGELLERAYARIDAAEFIAGDPVQFPRQYSRPEDIEVAGILCATLAWGRRASILSSCRRLLEPMGDSPYRYVMENGRNPSLQTGKAVHRTFSQSDLAFFLAGLRGVYRRYGSLEAVFAPRGGERGLWDGSPVSASRCWPRWGTTRWDGIFPARARFGVQASAPLPALDGAPRRGHRPGAVGTGAAFGSVHAVGCPRGAGFPEFGPADAAAERPWGGGGTGRGASPVRSVRSGQVRPGAVFPREKRGALSGRSGRKGIPWP